MPSLQRPRQSPDRRRRSLVRINLHLLLPPSHFLCFDGWHGRNRTTERTWRNHSSEWERSLADKYSRFCPLQAAVAAGVRRSHNPAERYTDSRVAASVSIAPVRRVRPRRELPAHMHSNFGMSVPGSSCPASRCGVRVWLPIVVFLLHAICWCVEQDVYQDGEVD